MFPFCVPFLRSHATQLKYNVPVFRFPFSVFRFPFSVFRFPFSVFLFPFSFFRFAFCVSVLRLQIALDALPDTFDLIAEAQAAGGGASPAIIGMVLNQTDRRTQQYRSKLPQIIRDADSKKLPPVFKHILGDHPQMEQATDYTLNPKTLRQRFGTYYDNVRKVAKELEKRCDEYAASGRQRKAEQYATRIRQVLAAFSR